MPEDSELSSEVWEMEVPNSGLVAFSQVIERQKLDQLCLWIKGRILD